MKPMPILLGILALLALAYAVGPRGRKPRLEPTLPPSPASPAAAEAWLTAHEAAAPRPLKPDNQARILWAGAPGQATEWAIVYLHGYSASWREGGPVHQNTAARYGANLLLTRLHLHGLQVDEPLIDFDAESYWADAKQALALAGALGKKTVLMATSSGAPLALRLAAQHPDKVQALVLYSPNLAIKNALAPMMAGPWGLQIARKVKGGLYNHWEPNAEEAKYWYPRQRLEGAVQLQLLLQRAYEDNALAWVKQPVFVGAYPGDNTISVPAIRKGFAALGTPEGKKRYREFPLAHRHVIACDITSGAWKDVQKETWQFLEEVVGLRSAQPR